MIWNIIIFLTLNFLALAIGGVFTGEGVPSEWYQLLNKAPWTPPGWVFGTAWSIIMVCLSIYMAIGLRDLFNSKKLIILFVIQWVLNVAWNPIFFHFREVLAGLIEISLLTLLVFYLLFRFRNELKKTSLLLVPYCVWLLIATSLNAYILIYN